ncbi:MAG: cobalamin-dependent protein [Anaerolineales bacterium]|nr:cobalamin-dependent protein [Anaerolineales bacterium]
MSLASKLENQKSYFAKLITHEWWREKPSLSRVYGADGYTKSVQDTEYHLSYLAQAIAVENHQIFVHYIEWLKVLFRSLNLPLDLLEESLEQMRDFLLYYFKMEGAHLIGEYLELGIKQMESPVEELSSHLDPEKSLGNLAHQYFDALLRSDRITALQLIREAVAQGISIQDIYLQVFEPCLHEVGRLWQTQQISIAQEHYFTASTQFIMAQLYPLIFQSPRNGRRMVAACAGNELHEIGLRMVVDFFEMEGWDTYYLGANTPPSTLVDYLKSTQADLLAISTTIPIHIRDVEELIRLVRKSKVDSKLKILTGGYPFNLYPDLWQKVGADGTAPNAEQAVMVAHSLLNMN